MENILDLKKLVNDAKNKDTLNVRDYTLEKNNSLYIEIYLLLVLAK